MLSILFWCAHDAWDVFKVLNCCWGVQVLYLEGEVLDLKGQLADMEEIKADLEGHVKDLSQELAAARQAAETQASERTAALQVGS